MADPLSIVASVVGIAAAGINISIKLYALAEKVSTASQRVTSIANDISSTCAILNQLHTLIEPVVDKNGQYHTAFNGAALLEISNAVRHCESIFKDIDARQKQAFKKVSNYGRPREKLELSKLQQVKWPFLQQEFDELRQDLQNSKINLALMVAVAHLAFAQNGSQNRQLDVQERAELKTTIIELQRARTKTVKQDVIAADDAGEERGLKKVFRKFGGMPRRKTSEHAKSQPRGQEDVSLNESRSPSQQIIASGGIQSNTNEAKPADSTDKSPVARTPSVPKLSSFYVTADIETKKEAPINGALKDVILTAWTTGILPGLSTGLAQSVDIHRLDMPQDKIRDILDRHVKENKHPLEGMYELNAFQRRLVLEHIEAKRSTLMFIATWHQETVPSVFGDLNVVMIIWITQMALSGDEVLRNKPSYLSEAVRPGLADLWKADTEERRVQPDPISSLRSARPTWARQSIHHRQTSTSSPPQSSEVILGFKPVKQTDALHIIKDNMVPEALGHIEKLNVKSEEDSIVDELLTKWTVYEDRIDPHGR